MNVLRLLLVCLSVVAPTLLLQSLAFAQEAAHVRVSLVPEVTSAALDDDFAVLFHQDIDPGWHTYWHNPGDSGAAPSITWNVPDGATIGEFRWPYPERIAYGPLMNYGYHDKVDLPFTVSISDAFIGDELTLTGSGRVLVCADICIPERVMLSLMVPVGEKKLSSELAENFAQARARVPTPLNVPNSYSVVDDQIVLTVNMPSIANNRVENVEYFPFQQELIDNPAEQLFEFNANGLQLTLEPGYEFVADQADMSGVLVITERAGEAVISSFSFNSQQEGVASYTGDNTASASKDTMTLWLAMLFAFLGGLILNLMPCVFPVLSIKILSLVESSQQSATSIRTHGLVYAAGVILSFVSIAATLIALRNGGAAIGWGFQLQAPFVVGLLAYLFLLIGLNLFGVFEIGTSIMSLGSGSADNSNNNSYVGSFSTGILATIVAAPCTAPFMGAAVGFALTQSAVMGVLVFAALGLGMAVPYVVLCYSPRLLCKLPRPGVWMETMRQVLAFPMFASAIWLLWVLGLQTGADGMMSALVGGLLLVFAIWLMNQTYVAASSKLIARTVGVLAIGTALYAVVSLQPVEANTDSASDTGRYSEQRLAQARGEGPVFVNFTAAWCITCKVNEINALSVAAVQQAFSDHGVTYLKADWTNEDPLITAALAEYGRSGVPLYLLYAPGENRARVLPQLLTEGIVVDAIDSM